MTDTPEGTTPEAPPARDYGPQLTFEVLGVAHEPRAVGLPTPRGDPDGDDDDDCGHSAQSPEDRPERARDVRAPYLARAAFGDARP